MKRKQIARVDLSNPDKPKLVYDVKAFKAILREFPHDGRVNILLETYYAKRSLSQNGTLHWWFDIIGEDTGMDMDEVKEYFAKKYLTVPMLDEKGDERADPETGELMTRVRGTSELDKFEFAQYMDKVFIFAQQFFNISLPLPEQQIEINLKNK